jgi:hypothetical protein
VTLYFHPTGPLLKYNGGTLYVQDLNPEINTHWRMSRQEMFWLGVRCFFAAVSGS